MPESVLPTVERSTVVDRLTTSLIDAAVSGRLVVGAALPPERELAAELDVNRATLRQAVARLEQIGLVTRRQGSGTVLRDPRQLTAPEVVGRVAAADDVGFLADLIEVREALAGVIGRRAQGRVPAERMRDLLEVVDAIEQPDTSPADRQALELAFFAVLVEIAGNQAIRVLLRWVEEVYAHLSGGGGSNRLPSITAAFGDGATVAEPLRALVRDIETGADLGAAMTRYAKDTGGRLVAAARRHPD